MKMPKEPTSEDRLFSLLREQRLAEPSPWFAAQTMARLRREHPQQEVHWGWGMLLRLLRNRAFGVGLACVLGVAVVGAGGWDFKVKRDRQRLMSAALDAVAKEVDASFLADEGRTWPETSF